MDGNRPILLVEDDLVDVMTTKRALKEIHVTNKLDIAENGEEAISYLKTNSDNKPCSILLDLNMPKMGGIEFLNIIKKEYDFKRIPIIVLTTSTEEQDMVKSYNLGVAGYIHKPVVYKDFVEAVKTIDLYWTLNRLPQDL